MKSLLIVLLSTAQVSAEGGKVSRVKKGIKSLVSNKKFKIATGVIVLSALGYYGYTKYSARKASAAQANTAPAPENQY